MAESEPSFKVGDKFSSCKELETAIDRYKKSNFVEFWRRDSRTIAAARKRGVERPLKEDLKYRD